MSFAPEATLHTWNVVEIPDDSTGSSNSNSTRRASSLTQHQNQASAQAEHAETPSTPDTEADSDIAFSPVHHEEIERLKNRPASAGSYIGGPDLSSSPFSGDSIGSEDTGMQESIRADDDDRSSDSAFNDDSTAMSMDDMTARSGVTTQSDDFNSSNDSDTRLNESLRQAAQEAGTQLIDFENDNGDVSMEMADQEITGAFQPWIKKGQRQSFDWGDISAGNDQENVDPSKWASTHSEATTDNEDEDLSMDVTNAIGGILSNQPSRRQSVARRKSSGAETNYDEQTMELTNVVGGIAQPGSPARSTGSNHTNQNEEMTMEFTSVVGGVMGNDRAPSLEAGESNAKQGDSIPRIRRRSIAGWDDDDDEGMEMDMTGAIGGILSPIREQPEDQDDDQTAGMNVNTAMGRILPSELESNNKDQAKRVMELESDAGQLGSSPFQEDARQSPARSPPKSPSKSPSKSPARTPSRSPEKSPAKYHVTAVASESGSPSLASVRSRRRRSSSTRRTSRTPTPNSRNSTSPAKKPSSPLKQVTNQESPSTPTKTPPSNKSPAKSGNNKSPQRNSLFERNATTGESTPSFVLQPRDRRSSGLGADKEGLGSPRVAAMLDTRRSLGEEIPKFVPQEQQTRGVRFDDPVKLHEEVDREREEEENREDGHINPLEPSGGDTTLNLREMISSLSPKKEKLRGRKSLHVGSARGLLGKRPAELDDGEDEDERSPKRLRGPGASPVKKVRLPAPPTVDETVGRSTRSSIRKSIGASPAKRSTTPTQEPPPRAGPEPDAQVESQQMDESPSTEDTEENVPQMQLQDFLNLTNIHFMELTTTKRRHTTTPGSASKKEIRLSTGENSSKPSNFEDCVAAGFCTLPMLELYQHVSLPSRPQLC